MTRILVLVSLLFVSLATAYAGDPQKPPAGEDVVVTTTLEFVP